MDTYYEYLRTFSQELGSRIVEMYPPVQGPNDPIAAPMATLLRKPLPAQALTISGLAKTLRTARSVRIVGECGTGKTLMSMGVAHAHANGAPYSAIAMCPPHLVLKWAREVIITVPRARAFVIYDLRNGGDPTRLHGVVEVQLQNGHAINTGLKTSLYELRAMGRQGWRKRCPEPAYFIVSRETGKLSYHWKHAFAVAESGPDSGRSSIRTPARRSSGQMAASSRPWTSTSGSTRRRSPGESRGRRFSPRCGRRIGRKIQRMAPLGYVALSVM